MLKYRVLIITTLLLADILLAQDKRNSFEAAVTAIKKNIACCSANFSGSSNKVNTVLIFKGGEMTIVYNNSRPPVSFNLFELYKDPKAPLGIYYQNGSKAVVFNIKETDAQAIRFHSVAKAKDTYEQLLFILNSESSKK